MRDAFVHEIDTVGDNVEEMALLARAMLRDGVEALAGLDRTLADGVIGRADTLAQMDEDIEAKVLSILALQQPMAGDMRRMGAALKLITYLNRIGRYGYDIARVTVEWPEDRGHVARMVSLHDMAVKVDAMLEMVISAYRHNHIADETELMALEDNVDAMRYSIFREALTYMAEDPHNIEPCAHYMMVARYLERCGDNICKMAEKLHFAVTGERLLLP